MAAKRLEQTETVEQTVSTEKQRFTLEKLRSECITLFGVTSSLFDGATYDLPRTSKFTVEEINEHIKAWKKKEVR